MAGNWTKGPWRYAATETHDVSHLVRCQTGHAVADVSDFWGLPAEANARLIAKAPELAAALAALLKLHEDMADDPLHHQARDILAQARGEA